MIGWTVSGEQSSIVLLLPSTYIYFGVPEIPNLHVLSHSYVTEVSCSAFAV